MLENKKIVFIIGAPRSGTTLLQTILASFKEVATPTYFDSNNQKKVYETETFVYVDLMLQKWEKSKIINEEFNRTRDIVSLLEDNYVNKMMSSFLYDVYSKIAEQNKDATILVDKFPSNFLYHDLITQFIPNAYFINIIRDCRGVILSNIAVNKKNVGIGNSNVVFKSKVWVNSIEKAEEIDEKRILNIQYENLINVKGWKEIQSIFNFLGVQIDEEIIKEIFESSTSKKYSSGMSESERKQLNLTTLEKYKINLTAGNQMLKQGYIKNLNWWYDNYWQKIFTPITLYFFTIFFALKNFIKKIFNFKIIIDG